MEHLYIPRPILAETERFLKRRGSAGKEGLVLWAGHIDNTTGRAWVLTTVKAGDSWPHGVRLRFRQMIRLTEVLASDDMILLAQVHNHPGNLPHSFGDERNPASHQAGYISIVVPNMGLQGIDPQRCFVYEYQNHLRWRELLKEKKSQLFKILPDGLHL
jgi:hypothetical protein